MQVCALPEWAMRTPIVSLEDFLAHQALRDSVRPQAGIETMRRIDAQSSQSQLVRVVDPALTLAVQGMVSSLLLPCFTRLNNLLFIGEGEQELEPFALLGASVQGLVRRLISEGLQAMGAKLEAPKGSSTYGLSGSKRRLLTPAHIVRGLVEGSRRRGLSNVKRALLLSIARLGVKVPEEEQEAVVGAPATITTDDERDTCAFAK
ncbi:hypothetical protein DFH11DRAFT_1067320 [Phellopilus nigrolimitatus]|nr:hypothetical protein DFH11DRAFT_1067320 [Phellopilus nigrolimitatus]